MEEKFPSYSSLIKRLSGEKGRPHSKMADGKRNDHRTTVIMEKGKVLEEMPFFQHVSLVSFSPPGLSAEVFKV